MERVKTARELGFEAKVGYEWDAGNTPPHDRAAGRWTVRRDPQHWAVLFHFFTGAEHVIHTFPPNRGWREGSQNHGTEAGRYCLGRNDA